MGITFRPRYPSSDVCAGAKVPAGGSAYEEGVGLAGNGVGNLDVWLGAAPLGELAQVR